jgi:hypothetical protein
MFFLKSIGLVRTRGGREGGAAVAISALSEKTLKPSGSCSKRREKRATYHNINIRNAFSGKILLNRTGVLYIQMERIKGIRTKGKKIYKYNRLLYKQLNKRIDDASGYQHCHLHS